MNQLSTLYFDVTSGKLIAETVTTGDKAIALVTLQFNIDCNTVSHLVKLLQLLRRLLAAATVGKEESERLSLDKSAEFVELHAPNDL